MTIGAGRPCNEKAANTGTGAMREKRSARAGGTSLQEEMVSQVEAAGAVACSV